MRNSSLVECVCAENVTGLKHGTEAAEMWVFESTFGRGAFQLPVKLDGNDEWRSWKCLCGHE